MGREPTNHQRPGDEIDDDHVGRAGGPSSETRLTEDGRLRFIEGTDQHRQHGMLGIVACIFPAQHSAGSGVHFATNKAAHKCSLGNELGELGKRRMVGRKVHFHNPSEHTLDSVTADLEAHLIHQVPGYPIDYPSALIVVGVLYDAPKSK